MIHFTELFAWRAPTSTMPSLLEPSCSTLPSTSLWYPAQTSSPSPSSARSADDWVRGWWAKQYYMTETQGNQCSRYWPSTSMQISHSDMHILYMTAWALHEWMLVCLVCMQLTCWCPYSSVTRPVMQTTWMALQTRTALLFSTYTNKHNLIQKHMATSAVDTGQANALVSPRQLGILVWGSQFVSNITSFWNISSVQCSSVFPTSPLPHLPTSLPPHSPTYLAAELASDHGLLPELWYNRGQDVEGVLHLPQPIAKEEAQRKSCMMLLSLQFFLVTAVGT